MRRSTETQNVQSATLIIWGGDFDPRDLTARLGMRPSKTWRKGEHKSFRTRDGVVRQFALVHQWSGWKKWLGDSACRQSLERQLTHWVARLEAKAHVLRTLRRRGVSIELNCYVGSESAWLPLSASLLWRIGKLGVDLDITWYASPRQRRTGERYRDR